MARIPSHPRIAAAQVSARWLAELSLADSSEEVISVARAYLDAWSPEELRRLPPHCRPERLESAKAIHELAFLLDRAQEHCCSALIDALVVDRMAAFFAAAARALDRIANAHEAPSFFADFQRRAA